MGNIFTIPFFKRKPKRLETLGIGTHSTEPEALGLIDAISTTHVRHTLYWHEWDNFRYREVWREGYERFRNSGKRMLVVVHGHTDKTGDEAILAYADFITDRAYEFPNVDAWQIWNEVDIPVFTKLFYQDPGLYGKQLRIVYPRLKQASPWADVVTSGFATGGAELSNFVSLIGRHGYDAAAMHCYGWPLEGVIEDKNRIIRRHMPHVPVWCTEFGMERKVLPDWWLQQNPDPKWEEEQAAMWKQAVAAFGRCQVQRAYGYQLQTEEPGETHGIFRPDGTKRPAADYVASFNK